MRLFRRVITWLFVRYVLIPELERRVVVVGSEAEFRGLVELEQARGAGRRTDH